MMGAAGFEPATSRVLKRDGAVQRGSAAAIGDQQAPAYARFRPSRCAPVLCTSGGGDVRRESGSARDWSAGPRLASGALVFSNMSPDPLPYAWEVHGGEIKITRPALLHGFGGESRFHTTAVDNLAAKLGDGAVGTAKLADGAVDKARRSIRRPDGWSEPSTSTMETQTRSRVCHPRPASPSWQSTNATLGESHSPRPPQFRLGQPNTDGS
jgi:hypothetical protein